MVNCPRDRFEEKGEIQIPNQVLNVPIEQSRGDNESRLLSSSNQVLKKTAAIIPIDLDKLSH